MSFDLHSIFFTNLRRDIPVFTGRIYVYAKIFTKCDRIRGGGGGNNEFLRQILDALLVPNSDREDNKAFIIIQGGKKHLVRQRGAQT